MAQIERSKQGASTSAPVPEYLIVDQSGQNCTGTFKMEGTQKSEVSVKNEPGLEMASHSGFSATVKEEVMDSTQNDSGFVDAANSGGMDDVPAVKMEPGLDANATSSPLKQAKDAIIAAPDAPGKFQCTVCNKQFASKPGAVKHASQQHKLA